MRGIGLEGDFQVMVVSSSRQTLDSVHHWANAQKDVSCDFVDDPEQGRARAEREHPEVLLVDLAFRGSEGIATGIVLARAAPGAEMVFLTEAMGTPEVRAAQDIGIKRFVVADALAEWLPLAIEPLARLARARRHFEAAQRAVSRLPLPHGEPNDRELPLGVAEGRYREAYLRATLARTGARRAAAKLAGVPYTTFCVMLRKLGIAPEDGE